MIVASMTLVAAYLLGRVLVFGSVTGGFSGLGTTFGAVRWPREVVKFVFRCFLPAGAWVLRWWPLAMVIAVAAASIVLVRARGAAARPLLFAAATLKNEKGSSVETVNRKMMVSAANKIASAISFGVF